MAEGNKEKKKESTKSSGLDTLFSWESAERYWVPRERPWFIAYSAFFVALIAIFALIGEYILIIAIIAFAFLWFTQAMVPPERAVHTITPLGIKTYGKLYKFDSIKHFWFSAKKDIGYVHFEIMEDKYEIEETRCVTLLIENEGEDSKIFSLLINRLDYGEPDEVGYNFLQRIISGKHIPVSFYLPKPEQGQEYLEQEKSNDNSSASE